MKDIKIVIGLLGVLGILMSSCSSSDDGGGEEEVVNTAPDAPGLIFPTDDLVCTSIDLEFLWGAVIDPDQDGVSYRIEVSEQSDFADIGFSATPSGTSQLFTLEKGVRYFWRVQAIDSQDNASDFSGVQTFFTEPEAVVNTIPSTPVLISPIQGAIVNNDTVTLEWSSSDADGDALLFDVYYGTSNPPELFAENVEATLLEVTLDLEADSENHYWRVVVKDSQQNAALSQVGEFTFFD